MTFFEELKMRGLIESITSDDLIDKINNGGLKFYIGTDPTADSLHIGHLMWLVMATRMKEHGHIPYILVGGGTGLIGDPRTTSERDVISRETLEHNYNGLKNLISKLVDCELVNNYDWYKDVNFIDYLRDYGKFFNVNYMLGKDTVKRRLDSGISYTEFSYMILQSIDFLHLYDKEGITLQVGGQDQWGNITSGLELIRKKRGENTECYGLTMPLITKADGTKFGKSESGAVWLSKDKTSPYEMYQFLLNSEDAKVIDYLKKLTFLSLDEISRLEESLNREPEKREAGKRLAYEVVKFLHGEEEAELAKRTSEEVFSGKMSDNMPTVKVCNSSYNILDLLLETSLCPSKSEARRMVEQGGIKVNGEKVSDVNSIIEINDIILQKGKKSFIKVECSK